MILAKGLFFSVWFDDIISCIFIWLLFWWSNQSLARSFIIWKFQVCNCRDIHFIFCLLYLLYYCICMLHKFCSYITCFFFFHFQSSFTDIAKVLSEFFRDLDIVPSDVIVGLVLLRKRQQLLRLRTIHQVRVLTMTSGF